MTTIKNCKGSTYDSPSDGQHLYVHPNFDEPGRCYYCNAREGNK
jgi:hypothetical protein